VLTFVIVVERRNAEEKKVASEAQERGPTTPEGHCTRLLLLHPSLWEAAVTANDSGPYAKRQEFSCNFKRKKRSTSPTHCGIILARRLQEGPKEDLRAASPSVGADDWAENDSMGEAASVEEDEEFSPSSSPSRSDSEGQSDPFYQSPSPSPEPDQGLAEAGAGPRRAKIEMPFTSPLLDLPLYENAPVSVKTHLLGLLHAAASNKFSQKALEDVLKVEGASLPAGHRLPTTVHTLHSLLGIDVDSFERHVCINDCMLFDHVDQKSYADAAEDACQPCGELRFGTVGRAISPRKKFYYIPLDFQIELLKKRAGFDLSMEQMREEIVAGRTTCLSSFWGSELAEPFLSQPDFLDNFTRSLVLSLGLDGVQCFKKGEYVVWPIAIKFWNLHPAARTSKEFVLLAGLIPGPSKPKSFEPYLQPLFQEILASDESGLLFC